MKTQVPAAFAVGRRRDLAANGLWDLFNSYSLSTWLAFLGTIILAQFSLIVVANVEARLAYRKCTCPMDVGYSLQLSNRIASRYSGSWCDFNYDKAAI